MFESGHRIGASVSCRSLPTELSGIARCRLGQMLYTVASICGLRAPAELHDPQRAHQDAGPQGPDDRRLLACGRADLLAAAGAEAGLRFRGPALGLHGHAYVVRLALAP